MTRHCTCIGLSPCQECRDAIAEMQAELDDQAREAASITVAGPFAIQCDGCGRYMEPVAVTGETITITPCPCGGANTRENDDGCTRAILGG